MALRITCFINAPASTLTDGLYSVLRAVRESLTAGRRVVERAARREIGGDEAAQFRIERRGRRAAAEVVHHSSECLHPHPRGRRKRTSAARTGKPILVGHDFPPMRMACPIGTRRGERRKRNRWVASPYNDFMSAERDPRVYFAGERTFIAWIRTGLAMMGFGFVVARFGLFLAELAATRGEELQRGNGSLWAGTALVLLGVLVNVYAAVEHVRFRRRFDEGNPIPSSSRFGILLAALLAAIGLAMSAYLIVRR